MKQHNYVSEEELLQIIESAETGITRNPPEYLKEQILRTVAKKDRSKQTKILLYFSAKVIAAAAASIALLFVLPTADPPDEAPRTPVVFHRAEDSPLDRFSQKTDQFCSFLLETTNSIFIKEAKK